MRLFMMILMTAISLALGAQDIRTIPTIEPEGNTFDDNVTITCSFPEGCSGGKYWINGGELQATQYTEPFFIDYSCRISVAGVNAEGRIITDVVTRDININRVTPAYYTSVPKEGVRKESFYVTRIKWNNVATTDLHLNDFKEGGSRHNEPVVWVTNQMGMMVAMNDYNGLWMNGLNEYKAYIYKDYDIYYPGNYILHIAKGVFVLDGETYDEEVQLHYEVSDGMAAPDFSPEPGEYTGPLTVTIDYPTDGSAFYKFYKINGAKAKSYTEPLVITETSTIEAYGMDEDFASATETATATYTIIEEPHSTDSIAAPVMTRSGNTVSINATEGATIKVWTNDNMNTAYAYSTPVEVDGNCKISCVAYTAEAVSRTVDMVVNDFPVDRGDMGEQVLVTPSELETVHLHALSANGRWAVGFIGSDTSSKGFIWDLDADEMKFASTIFVNQLWDIADDGTAYGWRLMSTDIDEDMTDEDIMWGICKDGVWTAQPQDMKVNGITPDGKLYGSVNNIPATYDFTTGSYTRYDLYDGGPSTGCITAVSNAAGYMGGYISFNGKHHAVIWKDQHQTIEYRDYTDTHDASITAISPNGRWAIIGQDYRANTETGEVEEILSMSERFHNDFNPEVLQTIADDGTIFGTYDGSMMSQERGIALVYTPDCRWRSIYDWMVDIKGGNFVNGFALTSMRGVSADHNLLLMHGTPSSISADDSFTHGIALKIDTKVAHLAPVLVNAQQMHGLEVIKVSWSAPITNANDVTAYTVHRNGTAIATLTANETAYYDYDVKSGEDYTYTLTATYSDGIESDESYSTTVAYALQQYLPVRKLALRQGGLNDVYLTWEAPIVSLPKLQYFNENSEWFAFGTDMYDSEWGIRIPATDLNAYEGMQIRTFQFLPSGPQQSYTINLYRGNPATGGYEAEPFYTQDVDPSALNFGVVNVIELNEPQELPLGHDLYAALFIRTAGNVNMLGVSYEGFISGYTDLCRIDGVFDRMEPISQNSSVATEIVLPIGIGICTENTYNGNIVKNYEVTDNGQPAGSTTNVRMKIEGVSEGQHEFAVTAIYRNDVASEKVTAALEMVNNEAAYVAVEEVKINVNSDKTVSLSWAAPLDEDRNLLHWGDLEPMPGLEVIEGFVGFLAGSVYPVTMTQPFAEDYEITEVFYCPLDADATYEVSLTSDTGSEFARFEPQDVEINTINYLKLEEPVTIDQSINYQLNVQAYDIKVGAQPLAYDSSGKWHNGYSNLFDYGYGYMPLSELISISEHPNWLMGLVIRRKDAKPMPLIGYDILVDGNKANDATIEATAFQTKTLDNGLHTAAVNVIYTDSKTVEGTEKQFVVSPDTGIEQLDADSNHTQIFDLEGRRVITDRMGRGLYIISRR